MVFGRQLMEISAITKKDFLNLLFSQFFCLSRIFIDIEPQKMRIYWMKTVNDSYFIKIASKTKVGRISVLKGGNKLSY